jgi:hypothetical protein
MITCRTRERFFAMGLTNVSEPRWSQPRRFGDGWMHEMWRFQIPA